MSAVPLALGGVIEAPYAVHRRGNHANTNHANIDPHAIAAEFLQDSHQANQQQGGQGEHIVTHIVILWVNPGAEATTTKLASSVVVENAPANTHTVLVGGEAGLVFVPESLSAAVGDTVHFVFLSKNHTVTQSTFDTPCKKMDGGIDSGFMPNPDNTIEPPPMMAVQVTTEKPLCEYSIQLKD